MPITGTEDYDFFSLIPCLISHLHLLTCSLLPTIYLRTKDNNTVTYTNIYSMGRKVTVLKPDSTLESEFTRR